MFGFLAHRREEPKLRHIQHSVSYLTCKSSNCHKINISSGIMSSLSQNSNLASHLCSENLKVLTPGQIFICPVVSDIHKIYLLFYSFSQVWYSNHENGYFHRSVGGEKSWGKRYFIQLKVMKEVDVLIQDLTLRLRRLGIAATTGYGRVIWSDLEKPLILKVCMCLRILQQQSYWYVCF